MAPPGSIETKLNASAQLQTFPYQTVSNSFPYSNALLAKVISTILPFKSLTDKKTKKHLTFFTPCPAASDTLTEEFRTIFTPRKLFRIRRTVSPPEALKISGKTHIHC